MNRAKIMWFASALVALAKYEAMKVATAFHPLALYHFLKLCPKK